MKQRCKGKQLSISGNGKLRQAGDGIDLGIVQRGEATPPAGHFFSPPISTASS